MRKVRPIYDRPDFHRWVVGESPPEASVLDLDPSGRDLLYVGGVPDLYRSDGDLESDGRLVGAVFAVEVGFRIRIRRLENLRLHSGVTDLWRKCSMQSNMVSCFLD